MIRHFVLILAILLLVSFYTPLHHICKAEVVWSDDFDDGNYDGWTVINGTFSVRDHTLGSSGGGLIIHPSSVTAGTWSFDIFDGSDADIGFVSNYPLAVNGLLCLYWSQSLERVYIDALGFHVTRHVGIWTHALSASMNGWQHYDITRDSDGNVRVYHNGTLVLESVLTWLMKSEYLWVSFHSTQHGESGDTGGAIDNVVVSNTIDVNPPSQPGKPFYQEGWFMVIVPAGVVAVAVVVALLQSRKS